MPAARLSMLLAVFGAVEPSQINGLGFMLSDKQPGGFPMQVEWLKVQRPGE